MSIEKEQVNKIFRKKKIEIIRIIRKNKGLTITEIAKMTKKELTAVTHDLKILAGLGIIQLEKQSRIAKATVNAKVVMSPLVELNQLKF